MNQKSLQKELTKVFKKLVEEEPRIQALSQKVHPQYRLSAKNLYRYLILRSYDLRKYHDSLSEIGISSLRSSEGYVYSNLYTVLNHLLLMQGKHLKIPKDVEEIGYKKSVKLLRKHSDSLFHVKTKDHFTEIMVTLPNEAADDKVLLEKLMLEGMEIARINLSHGDLDIWTRMVENIQELRQKLRMDVKIYMDLSGPKLRTSQIEVKTRKGKIKQSIKLEVGDRLILTKRPTKGKPKLQDKDMEVIQQAEVGVMLPEIIDGLKEKDLVYFDDGMIKAEVLSKKADEAEIVITEAYKRKLSSHKGINLPISKLNLPSLTKMDIELLPFVCENADMLGYSFVRTPKDVQKLYRELDKNGNKKIGVIFKIENQEAFENLPLILLEGMKRKKIGVMIARGDLAVEIGFERIAEVQNEILWICEAAHIPVIWATQVLENLAKTGIPTRAEVTDAAQSAQAECVMLNKGPHIVKAVCMLKGILSKMGAHSHKKKNAMRPLKVAQLSLKELNKRTGR
jgi:pyruvate kinase